ncbi:MAG: NAD(P)H-dependent oxidoreductase [Bdellovibrionales bacterium]
MPAFKIAVLVGSLRKESFNRKLADALAVMAPPDFSFKQLQIGDLPLYNQDDDSNQAPSVKRLKKEIQDSQGVLFVTPEYNRSVSGVLKNAIDHASRPYGQSAWAHKPAAVIGVSPGAVGTAVAQQHLRNILVTINMPTLAAPEAFIQATDALFDASGNIGEGSKKFLEKWMSAYVAWIKKNA